MSDTLSAASHGPARYSRPAIILHWLIFLVVALALFAIEIRGPRGSDSRAFWTGIHMWAGVTVLCLTVARLVWRLVHGAPAAEQGGGWLQTCARSLHWLFYILLIAQPLLGILMINSDGHPVRLMGTGISISLIGENGLADTLEDIHEFVGNTLYYLIGLHALAALWHQYVLKDGTLRKMLWR
ncbi:cytochrome b [Bordetella genomosp. 11]|uniref:Cytochrome B n=1 Tax=Bordetella genomosp. 11 TaxID=1416808 RepID=A0A261UT06_9BORD|nr:cytochrome b [Bordetella genomosp. 11]OZI64390.1 cytochrome B [Bordetella genomosp. 11]